MSDGAPDPARSKDALLYDYSKHLLSLALLGVGGIVSIAQSPVGRSIPGPQVAMLITLFALSGLCALSCSAAILRATRRDEPMPHGAWAASQGAMLFLGLGVGSFLTIWINALV